MKMKNLIFCVAMNFISAIVLIGAGAMEMNNLVTSVPAILCIIAGICGIIGIKYLFFLPVDRNIAGVLHIVADDVEAAGKRNFTYTVDRKRRTNRYAR
jgi:hypothetical protein